MHMQPYLHRKFSYPFKALVTGVLILSLIADPVVFAASADTIFSPKTPLKIPESLGRIEESAEGASGKTILYIQDAHDSLEAQENIAKLIERFVEKNGVKTVYEEGYEGPVPTDSYFGFIMDPKIRKKVSYFLLDKLRLRAAEYAHINRFGIGGRWKAEGRRDKTGFLPLSALDLQPSYDFKLIGADSIKLHAENIAQYRKSAKSQKRMTADLEKLSKELETVRSRNFPKDFKEWIKLKERYERRELPLLDYLKRSFSLLPPAEIREFPYLKLLLAADKTQNETLVNRVKAADTQDLFQEISGLENAVAGQLLKSEKDRETFQHYKIIHLLKRLGEMEVTSAEFEAAKAALKSFNTQEFAEFIARELHKPVLLSKRWEYAIQRSIQFYELAEARNQALAQSLDDFMRNPDENIAVLVFGGFHKDSIREIFHRKEIAYSIITPKISAPDPVHQAYYKQLMGTGHHDFEIPLAVRTGVPTEGVYQVPYGRAEIVAVYGGASAIEGSPAD